MAVEYVGAAGGWKQKDGGVFGTTPEGSDFARVPYEGPEDGARAFKQSLAVGAACPIPGWTHCALQEFPTFRKSAAGVVAELFFSAPDSDGLPSANDIKVRWGADRQMVSVSEDSVNFVAYSYDAPTVVGTYVDTNFPTFDANDLPQTLITGRLSSELGRVPDPKLIKAEQWPDDYEPPDPDAVTKIALREINMLQSVETDAAGGGYRITEKRIKYWEYAPA